MIRQEYLVTQNRECRCLLAFPVLRYVPDKKYAEFQTKLERLQAPPFHLYCPVNRSTSRSRLFFTKRPGLNRTDSNTSGMTMPSARRRSVSSSV